MLKRLSLLMMVIVLAFVVVACGDDEEPASGGGGTTTEETTTQETPEATEGEEGGGGGGSDVADNPQVQAAVEQCKSAIQAQPQLSNELKAELEDLCDKAASGDIKDAQEASVEVCKKIAEELVPDEAAREQVIQQCEAAAAQP